MPAKLPDSQQALAQYLDDMLHQATRDTHAAAVTEKKPSVLLPQDMLAREFEPSEPLASPDEAGEPAQKPESELAPQAENDEIQFPLQCLMFSVAGHQLSVPLIQLSGVITWQGGVTRLPQSPAWLLGLVKHRDSNLRVVDSRQLLNIASSGSERPEHLLVLGDGAWAITCDQLGQVVNLESDDIQWKPDGVDSLALGTIRESLSTLLSPPGIRQELDSRAAPAAG